MEKLNSNNFSTKENSLLFLHGYLADSKTFFNQIQHFEKFLNVFAFDLKGFGTNANMQYPYSLDDYIDEVNEYKYKHNIVKPHLIAHSFGGRIALKGLYKDKNFCDKLVLTGSAGLKPKITLNKKIKKLAFNILSKFIDKKKLTKFYSKDYLALNPIMQKSFVKIVNEHLDYTLTSISNKTLIIFGEDDRETPLYMAKKLNKNIKNSKLIIMKNAGHFCFIDKPLAFNLAVENFLLNN